MEETTEALAEQVTEEIETISNLQSYISNNLIPALAGFMIQLVVAITVYLVASKVINKLKKIVVGRMHSKHIDQSAVIFISNTMSTVLKGLVVVGLLGYLGVNNATIVAAFGSIGVGIGLALQGGMANFAGGVLITFLKPFEPGDYIVEVSDKIEGTVSKIDMFYTTLKTFDDKVVIVPNETLTNGSVINLTKSGSRRVDITVGISYRESILKAKKILEQIVAKDHRILKDRPIDIFVDELGSSSVNLGIHVYTKAEHYWSVRWSLNESIKLRFDEEGIEIPYRQVDVHMVPSEVQED